MNKKYLMNGFAALALVASVSSCTKDVTAMSQGEIDAKAKENAELQLGFSIPDGQTWNMASQVEANVTVNGDYGANYTVTIYENNPFINNTGVVLGKAEVTSGGTATFDFTCPNNLSGAFAAIKDVKGYSYVKPVGIIDGKLEASFTFPGNTASARSMRSARRSAADDYVIPTRTMPNLSDYIDDAVAINDENNTTDPANTVHHYLIPEGTTWSKNIPLIQSGSGISVYVQGTLNINAEQRVNGGCVFIVGPKGTVNIASGKQLVTNANNNAGTVGSFYVYPGGQVKGEGKLQFANGTGSYNYNGGTIKVGTINNNGGELYNAGIIESDYLEGGAGGSRYVNAGKVHIKAAVHGSQTANLRIINNCWWEVDGAIACRNIVQGEGAYFHSAKLEMSGSNDETELRQACIWAKGNSLIDVPGSVVFNNVDIVGPTGEDYAFLQFGKAVNSNGCGMQDSELKPNMNYTGGWGSAITVGAIQNNIYMSIDTADEDNNIYTETAYEKLVLLLNGAFKGANNGNSNYAYNQSHIVGNNNAYLIGKGEVGFTTKTADECSPGVAKNPPTPIYETLKVYTYAFEDQTVGTDYDMNDVVLKVNYKVKSTGTGENAGKVEYDKTKLAVKLVAAGATYNIKVKIFGNYIFGGEEIHNVLKVNGVAVGAGVMVNTGNGKAVTATPATDEIDVPTDWNGDFTTLPVSIEVTSTNTTYSYPNTDEYPHAIMVPTDWAWPLERINVKEAYSGTSDATKVTVSGVEYPVNSFAAWGGTPAANRTSEMEDWYNNPLSGKVMINTNN